MGSAASNSFSAESAVSAIAVSYPFAAISTPAESVTEIATSCEAEDEDATLGIASFYLRAVCQNRNLWGVEDFEEITIRHSKYAASRFAHEAAPALTHQDARLDLEARAKKLLDRAA